MSAAWPRNLQLAPELVTQTYPIGPMTIWSKLLTIEEFRRAHSAESQANANLSSSRQAAHSDLLVNIAGDALHLIGGAKLSLAIMCP